MSSYTVAGLIFLERYIPNPKKNWSRSGKVMEAQSCSTIYLEELLCISFPSSTPELLFLRSRYDLSSTGGATFSSPL